MNKHNGCVGKSPVDINIGGWGDPHGQTPESGGKTPSDTMQNLADLASRAKGFSESPGNLDIIGVLDPCSKLAALGRQAFEAGLPVPDPAASGYTNEQYQCFIDGYYTAQQQDDEANDNTGLIYGGLAVVGLIGGLWLASKKGWI